MSRRGNDLGPDRKVRALSLSATDVTRGECVPCLFPADPVAEGVLARFGRHAIGPDRSGLATPGIGRRGAAPLAVISGSLEAILDGVHPPDEAHLAALLDETRVLERLIEDLRTLALAEAGTLALHREPTDIATLARDVAAAFAGGGVSVAVEADPPPALDVDPVRIRQVLANLVANAVRHTPPDGTVRLTVRAGSGGGATVEVADEGPGIPPELLPHVFERFVKSPASRGSGLGLAIAKQLVEAHGGTIAAESAPGAGTRVMFELPAN